MIAILLKSNFLIKENIKTYYLDKGVPADSICKPLLYSGKNYNAKEAKEYIDSLLPSLYEEGVDTLFVCDAAYFKLLSGEKKTEFCYGNRYTCKQDSRFQVVLGLNYMAFKYDPSLLTKLQLSIEALNSQRKQEEVLTHMETDPALLEAFLCKSTLSVDIETTGLVFYKDDLVSIAFADDMHGGIVFDVTQEVYPILREFFENYKGTLIFHNASFDVKMLIYKLWMKDLQDQEGLQKGLHIMYRSIHDTKIISYLALNSTGKPKLGLKHLALEYTGNYALDEIDNILSVPKQERLEYNLIDCCATWFVFNKYYQEVVDSGQEDLYKNLLIPTQKVLTHTELTGLFMDMEEVAVLQDELQDSIDTAIANCFKFPEVLQAEQELAKIELDKINAKLKRKKLDHIDFKINLRSNRQLAYLLYEVMKLPILHYTESNQPSTKKDTIEELKSYCKPEQKDLMSNLIDLANSMQIMNNFIPAMLNTPNSRLYGNFNIGGTVSGRLSSSGPNLQNLPSTGTPWAKPFKRCFKAPKGFVFCGSDFASLNFRRAI